VDARHEAGHDESLEAAHAASDPGCGGASAMVAAAVQKPVKDQKFLVLFYKKELSFLKISTPLPRPAVPSRFG
jgi:hypothetical protein